MTAAIFITLRGYSVHAQSGSVTSNTLTFGQSLAIATAANATLDASGTFATLNAVASDSLGGADLIYTWSVTGGNASEVDFEDNYDNTANATFADFYAPGNYTLTLTVDDGVDAPVTTSANVTVTAIVSDIEVASTDPTPGADGTQHPLISNLTATPATSTSITLNWQSPDDAETNWIIQQLSGGSYVDVDTVSGTSRDYTVAGLDNSFDISGDQNLINYTFRVIGADDSPESVSDPVTAYTAGDGSAVPTNMPTMITSDAGATYYSAQGIPGSATGVEVQMKQDGDWTSLLDITFGSESDPDESYTWGDASVQNEVHPGTFQMRARYYNTGGFGDWGDTTTYTVTLSPPAPDSVTATANANGTVTLEVNPGTPADDYSGYANNEDILISGSNDDGATFDYSDSTDQNWDVEEVDGVEMPVAIPTTVTLSGLDPATHYIFEVSVGAPGINSDDTGLSTAVTVDVTTYDANATVPNAPSDLVIVPQSGNGTNTTLEWTDHSENESGFMIQKSSDGSTWANLTLTAADTRAYTDTDADDAGDFFQVAATNDAGTSSYSNTVNANVPTPPSNLTLQTAADYSGIELAWQDNSTNESGFEIDRSTSSDFSANLTTFDVGENTTYYEDTSAVAGTQYWYEVAATYGSPAQMGDFSTSANGTLTLPTLSIASNSTDGTASGTVETGDVAQFELLLSAPALQDEYFNIGYSAGDAIFGSDYTGPTAIEIKKGQEYAFGQVTPLFYHFNEDPIFTYVVSLIDTQTQHFTIGVQQTSLTSTTPQIDITPKIVLGPAYDGNPSQIIRGNAKISLSRSTSPKPVVNAGDEIDLAYLASTNFHPDLKTLKWTIDGSGKNLVATSFTLAPEEVPAAKIPNQGGTAKSTGNITLLTNFTTPEIQFFWIDGDSTGVDHKVSLSINGQSVSATFEVKKPEYRPAVEVDKNVLQTKLIGGSSLRIGFVGGQINFIIKPKPSTPLKVTGMFQWVQIAANTGNETLANGKKLGYDLKGLDNFFPYEAGSDYQKSLYPNVADAPDVIFNIPIRVATLDKLTYDFKMYMQWKSPVYGSNFVPMGDIHWTYSIPLINIQGLKVGSFGNVDYVFNTYPQPTANPETDATALVTYPDWSYVIFNGPQWRSL